MTPAPLEAVNLVVGRAAPLLGPVSFALPAGTHAALLGPNGAGKTTLLDTLAGLLPPLGGAVLLSGVPQVALDRRQRARRVARAAAAGPLDEGLTVREFVTLGRTAHLGPWGRLTPEDEAAVARATADTALTDFADRTVATLSEGERARARLACALAAEAPALLLDEPTAHLDWGRRRRFFDLVAATAVLRGTAVLSVLHDPDDAFARCAPVWIVDGGRLVDLAPLSPALRRDTLARVFDAA